MSKQVKNLITKELSDRLKDVDGLAVINPRGIDGIDDRRKAGTEQHHAPFPGLGRVRVAVPVCVEERGGTRETAAGARRNRAVADGILQASRRVDDVLGARHLQGDVPEMTGAADVARQHAAVAPDGAGYRGTSM